MTFPFDYFLETDFSLIPYRSIHRSTAPIELGLNDVFIDSGKMWMVNPKYVDKTEKLLPLRFSFSREPKLRDDHFDNFVIDGDFFLLGNISKDSRAVLRILFETRISHGDGLTWAEIKEESPHHLTQARIREVFNAKKKTDINAWVFSDLLISHGSARATRFRFHPRAMPLII